MLGKVKNAPNNESSKIVAEDASVSGFCYEAYIEKVKETDTEINKKRK